MRLCSTLFLCVSLAACGGGGNGPAAEAPVAGAPATPVQPAPAPEPAPAPAPTPAPTPEPVPAPAATLPLSSATLRTIAGGTPVALSAASPTGGTVRWQLSDGAPGLLSASLGATVRYLPPASLAAATTVTLTASDGDASAAMTLAVTPDPGAPGITLVAGSGKNLTADGVGAAASFRNPSMLAADGAGNLYVMEYYYIPGFAWPSPRLRKIAPDGTVTTLVDSVDGTATWFGRPDTAGNGQRLDQASGFAADRAGNLYVSKTGGIGHSGEVYGLMSAILKISPSGTLSLLAGTEDRDNTGAVTDGTGANARFLHPVIAGIDYDGNLYVRDTDQVYPSTSTLERRLVPRKVTPAGVVTTLSALPASLNADMNGNTYGYDNTTKTVVRTTPDGVKSVEVDAPFCDDEISSTAYCVRAIVPTGGASYAMISGARVVRLVVRH